MPHVGRAKPHHIGTTTRRVEQEIEREASASAARMPLLIATQIVLGRRIIAAAALLRPLDAERDIVGAPAVVDGEGQQQPHCFQTIALRRRLAGLLSHHGENVGALQIGYRALAMGGARVLQDVARARLTDRRVFGEAVALIEGADRGRDGDGWMRGGGRSGGLRAAGARWHQPFQSSWCFRNARVL